MLSDMEVAVIHVKDHAEEGSRLLLHASRLWNARSLKKRGRTSKSKYY
jgi:hypothetical protein